MLSCFRYVPSPNASRRGWVLLFHIFLSFWVVRFITDFVRSGPVECNLINFRVSSVSAVANTSSLRWFCQCSCKRRHCSTQIMEFLKKKSKQIRLGFRPSCHVGRAHRNTVDRSWRWMERCGDCAECRTYQTTVGVTAPDVAGKLFPWRTRSSWTYNST
jgi:hypothetical protein